ncbi:hypothetical protein DV737_g4253, partial [Chaetothyriales sp. CBS 132003]
MSWRNQGITGSNNIPLGNRRRFGGDSNGNGDGRRQESPYAESTKRGRSPARAEPSGDGVVRRKKRNRWGDATDNKAAGLMGLPTKIEATMTSEQLEAYTLHLRIEEISQKLRINDVVPAEGDRSPSPPPQYDNLGRRVNTREFRYRKKLEDERHKLIEKAMKTIPNYHPPSDYRRPTKTQEKVYVPVNDYPEINFSNTLKKMESESGAKIAIRGKGSVKEGKGRSDAAHASNQEEDLHCLIMADTEEKVNKAKELIHNVIETAASIPEGQNELKRNQLRELAALNGTLRDDENQACQNCGQLGHRKFECPEQRNFTANIICRVCGGTGHIGRDCPERQRGSDMRNPLPGGHAQRRLGGGDLVDREMETRANDNYSGYSGYGGGAPGSNAAPWHQQPPPGQSYAGYQGYQGYDLTASYGAAPAAPPGLSDYLQHLEMSQLFSQRSRHSQWRKLWLLLAECEKELGIEIITFEALEQMRQHLEVSDADFEVAKVEEKRRRHDVMAHVHAFGAVAPAAAGIIHYGSASEQPSGRKILYSTLKVLNMFEMDYYCEGTTGTQASFLEIFGGDGSKCDQLNELLCQKAGFPGCYDVSTQTYSRKVDLIIANAICGLAATAQKITGDIRHLASWKEVEEPFSQDQIGSSAMAYKRNPMRCERVYGLSRELLSKPANFANTLSDQWMERTLDDSSIRRIDIPEMFLLADAILGGLDNITSGLVVYPERIASRVQEELPFMITESLMMRLCAQGLSRQDAHEEIRVISHQAGRVVKNEGKPNDLVSRIKATEFFRPIWGDIDQMLRPELYIGRSVEIVERYCGPGGVVEEKIKPYKANIEKSATVELDV